MPVVFENGPIFVGGGTTLHNTSVLVEDGIIKSVQKTGSAPLPDCRRVDLKGRTLLPGLIDSHVHLVMSGEPDPMAEVYQGKAPMLILQAAVRAQNTLMAGFTTVRDMGCKDYVALYLRDAVNQGLVPGPRILASGRVITMTGGHGWQIGGREADGPDEVRKATREQLKQGVDLVKVMATGGVLTLGVEPGCPQLSYEELKACIEEAHKAGRRVGTHAQGMQGIKNAVLAGVDTVEHGIYLSEEIINEMISRKTALIPTLSAPVNIMNKGTGAGMPLEVVTKTEKSYESHLASAAMAYKSGVKMAMGTDAGTPFNLHGENAKEIKLLTTIGMTPSEALTAATLSAAQVLGIDNKTGSIEKDKEADLLVVEGDPVTYPEILIQKENLLLIMKQGQVVKDLL
ncbi:metal-dependent hydrolase family protein [Dethiosulfatarculus sandiegensis]|uniref:Amidohydrolase n=1 Tax=Dethiosulfatarculus sandiegensis TaxID=1429043 RepID=A0A0D2JDH1_9BACT|nr:amidohydrolase family protein [Dethiosulfatarculus sandiegensis]KIX13756.1 amidohydrolase [Dethiosulfatarculus sandiegensis]